MHHQLEKLKTLWLTHNKLVRLVLTVGREVEDELEASLEEPSQGPAKVSFHLGEGGLLLY